jgi:hypothetical protein
MNRDMGMEIGDMVGEGVDVDVDVGDDGNAVGEYLRAKSRINITKPLIERIFQTREGQRFSDMVPF